MDHLQLEVPSGAVCGFLGRNGAGKTTTIKILMNLLKPTAGQVEVLGLDPRRDALTLWRQVGYVAENPVLYGWIKVRELVWFTGQFYDTWNQSKVEGFGQTLLPRHERPTGLGGRPRGIQTRL